MSRFRPSVLLAVWICALSAMPWSSARAGEVGVPAWPSWREEYSPPPAPPPAFSFDDSDCGPPAEEIPGPPPRLIVVGQPMSYSWLMCYIKQDFEGQDYRFKGWGEIRLTSFQGYPVECWTAEAAPGWNGRRTDGIVAQVYGTNRDGAQFVRFTYRIQLDGDYINNCQQEILAQP